MTVDEEVQAIRARWAEEDAASAARKEEYRQTRVQDARRRMLNGERRSSHAANCNQCLRAVLACDPGAVCDVGKTCEKWWE
jgi:hypothetical protein